MVLGCGGVGGVGGLCVGLASRVVAPRSANRTKSHLNLPSVSLQEPKLAVAFLFRQKVCRSYAEVVRVMEKQPGQVEDMNAFWTRLDSPGMGSGGRGQE